jgi:hypothetical protein
MRRAPLVIPSTTGPSRDQLIDEFGELDRQIQEFAPKVKRHKALQEVIRSWYQGHPADQPAIAEGHLYTVQVGARSEERYFDLKAKAAIWKRMGKAAALEAFNITLKAVEEALGKFELEALVSKANVGTRKLIPVLKAPVAGKAA